jgi:ketosteroid isomerase-like protein
MDDSGAPEVEKLEALYESWSRGDFSPADIFDPELELESHGMGERLNASGIDEFVATMAHWLSAWDRPLRLEAEELIGSGDQVLALVRWRGRGKGSGIEVDAGGAHIWTFRDGLVIRFAVYRDRDEARAALAAT